MLQVLNKKNYKISVSRRANLEKILYASRRTCVGYLFVFFRYFWKGGGNEKKFN